MVILVIFQNGKAYQGSIVLKAQSYKCTMDSAPMFWANDEWITWFPLQSFEMQAR